jgi:type IX secretion system PorP/SprF family membrane protein
MKILSISILLAFTFLLKSQVRSFSQYNRVNMVINPARTGDLKSWTVNYHFRNQWTKLNADNIIKNNVGIQYGFEGKLKGVGVSLLNSKTGGSWFEYNKTSILVPLAFGFKIKDKLDLSLGLAGRFTQYSVRNSQVDDLPNSTKYDMDFSTGMELIFANLKFGASGANTLDYFAHITDDTDSNPFKFTTYLNYDIPI